MKRSFRSATLAALVLLACGACSAADEPLVLARDGFFYVGGKTMPVDGHDYFYGQMYVEIRIPAKQTHPYPIIMVHGGTMLGHQLHRHAGRPRRLGAVFRRARATRSMSSTSRAAAAPASSPPRTGPMHNSARDNSASRFVSQEKFKLWPQAHLHTQWPGNGEPDDPATLQLAIEPACRRSQDFDKQQPLNRDALIALVDKIGPSILMTHSQGGAFGWPVADARPDRSRRSSRSSRTARPVYARRFHRRAGLLQGGQARAALWHHRGAARPIRRR